MATYNTHRITKKSEVDRFSSASYVYQMEGNTDNFNTNILDHTGFSTTSPIRHMSAYQPFEGAIRFNKNKDSLGTELVIGTGRNIEGNVNMDIITYNDVPFYMNIPEIVELKYPLDKVKLYETNSTTIVDPDPKPSGYTTPTVKYDFLYPSTFDPIKEFSPSGTYMPTATSTTNRHDIGKGWFVFYVITSQGTSLNVKLQCSENYPVETSSESFHVLGRLVPMFSDPDKTTKIETITLNYSTTIPPAIPKASDIKEYKFEYWKWVQYSTSNIRITKQLYPFRGSGSVDDTTNKYTVNITGGFLEGKTASTSSYYIPDSTIKDTYSDTKAYIYFLDLAPDPTKGYVKSPSRFSNDFDSVVELDIVLKDTKSTQINDIYAKSNIISEALSKNTYSFKDPRIYEGVITVGTTTGFSFGIPGTNMLIIGAFAKGKWGQIYTPETIPIQNYNIQMPVQKFNFQGVVSLSKTTAGQVDLVISGGTVYTYGNAITITTFSQTNVSKGFHAYIRVIRPTVIGSSGSASIKVGIPPASDDITMNIDLGYVFDNKLKGSLDWYQANFGDIFVGF